MFALMFFHMKKHHFSPPSPNKCIDARFISYDEFCKHFLTSRFPDLWLEANLSQAPLSLLSCQVRPRADCWLVGQSLTTPFHAETEAPSKHPHQQKKAKKPFLHVVPFIFSSSVALICALVLVPEARIQSCITWPCYRCELMCKNKKCNTSKCWLKRKKKKVNALFYISNNTKKLWEMKIILKRRGKKELDGLLVPMQFRKLNRKWRSGHVCWCWNGQNLILEVLPNEGNVSSSSSSGCAWAASSPCIFSQPSNFFTSNRVFSFTHMWQWGNKVWVYVSCRSRKNSLPWDLSIAVF